MILRAEKARKAKQESEARRERIEFPSLQRLQENVFPISVEEKVFGGVLGVP